MSAVLMAAAVVCLALATLFLFEVATVDHPMGWLGLGLTLWAAAVLVGAVAPLIGRSQQ